jgi:hypothetical protein
MDSTRLFRSGGVFAAAFLVLYFRFSAGVFPGTEVDPFVHFALIPISLLLGAANWTMANNGTASPARVDGIWGLSAALASFGVLHWAKIL